MPAGLAPVRARMFVFLAIFLTSAGFDQASKEWARDTLAPHVTTPVIQGYWDWQLERNPGAAFSLFAGTGENATRVGFAIVAVLAMIAVGIAALRTRPEQRMRRVAYALIAGGALGNVIDRIAAGSVTDFVRWHVHAHLWPVFNLADAVLLIGVALVLVESARRPRPQPATG
jgi:signal peptidase II